MPNTGQFSRKCYSCRQRRIKCDLARPSCAQCLRIGKPCSGYRDEVSMRFRIAQVSSFQSTRHGHQKIHYHDPPLVKADSPKGDIPSVQIVYEPSQVWSQHVIPLVLDKFAAGLEDSIDSSMFATIPRIISSTQEGSPVHAVCDAIAYAYLSSTTRSAAALVNRARAYGTALRAVNGALADLAQCKNDSTLLAIWMFVVYEQAKALIAGRESPSEVLSWIDGLRQYMEPSEFIMIQACTFAYHSARLCSRIRKVLASGSDLALPTSSILQQMDETEKMWGFSYDSAQPSISSIGVHAYQGNFQMRLSANVSSFLLRVCQAGCSGPQYVDSMAIYERCVATFRITATRILRMQGMLSQGNGQSPSEKFNLGWADAVMVYGSLRTIAISPSSLRWQTDAAKRACAVINERLGFQLE